ncbi:hypothetical protein ABZY09_46755 [Streptomyces sp. NPDC002928]|uniref:hypothetical protein n=1 Tax=Streptomyces sp. NPDC002928 TaxID=3154440 RepID=UPI0033BDE3F9
MRRYRPGRGPPIPRLGRWRIPSPRLAVDPAELEFKGDSLAYGICELPVTW